MPPFITMLVPVKETGGGTDQPFSERGRLFGPTIYLAGMAATVVSTSEPIARYS